MNRAIKGATVMRFYDETHDKLRTHLTDFVAACNFARHLKTLKGLMPSEYVCKPEPKSQDDPPWISSLNLGVGADP